MRKVKRNQRNKAFLGSLIGAGVSLIGNTIGSIIGANAQKKQQREQERQQIEQNNLTTAANLANAINGSQDVVDSYYDRVTLMPLGGKRRIGAWGTQDTNDVISGVSNGLGSVVKSAIGASTMGNVQTVRQAPAQFEPKVLVRPTYYNRIQPMQNVFKCGGRNIARGGTRKRGKNEYSGKPNKSENFYVGQASLIPFDQVMRGGDERDGQAIVGLLPNANSDVFYSSPRIKSNNEGMTQEYETQLNAEEEQAFQNWYRSYSRLYGLDGNPDHPAHQYDYRGYWLNELKGGNEPMKFTDNGHLPDTYKRPGHPTFSKESIYSTPETPGGTWDDDTFIPSWFNNVVSGDLNGNKGIYRNGELVGRLLPEIVIEGTRGRRNKTYKRKAK